jgi:LPXTG-motif cell wall-anchored protein
MSKRQPGARRATIGAALASLIATTTLVGFAVSPAHAAAPGGPYNGFATGSAVHVGAIEQVGATRLADFELGVTNAAVNSEGMKKLLSEYSRAIIPASAAGKNSRGHSTIAELGLGLTPPDADNQIAPFVAQANAPKSSKEEKSVFNQSIGPLLHVDLLRNVAIANWNPDTCVIGEPISEGSEHLARVQALETADKPATPESSGFDTPLVALNADKAGPDRGVTGLISLQQLYKGKGPGLGLQSVTAETLAPVTLFKGTPNEFTIEFDGPAFLSATADGTVGGAKLDFHAPLVSVIQGGLSSEVLPGSPVNIAIPGTGEIAQIKLGVAAGLPAPKGLGAAVQKLANGTRAAGVANVVEVKLLSPSGFNGATIALGHMETNTQVPAGGITCPIPVTKVANPPAVVSGQQFLTTITVHNPFACPITNVAVTDDITVEKAALFKIIGTTPTANSSPSGSNLSKGTVKWLNLGTIAPGGTKVVTTKTLAQGGSGRIIDTATATGQITNCNLAPGKSSADVTALAKLTVPAVGLVNLVVPSGSVLGKRLAKTGVSDRNAMLLGIGLIGVAGLTGALARRRRSRA